MKLGYFGPFLGAQLDLTTVANEEYITFSIAGDYYSEEAVRNYLKGDDADVLGGRPSSRGE